MNKKYKIFFTIISILLVIPIFASCSSNKKEVVIYTSVDQVYSEKIFKDFEAQTGIKVKAVFDIEADKTVGLANKLINEKDNPQADVFWNGEILQTIRLKSEGVLDTATVPNSKNLPDSFYDTEDHEWYAFGGRARVLVYNKSMISKEELPKTLEEFASSPDLAQSGLAYPVFGTTSTHGAVLYALWGQEKAEAYYKKLQEGNVRIVDGNGVVVDYTDQKKIKYGLTDTDDALLAMKTNDDIDLIFLDQEEGGIGTLVIPNSVSKIKGGPNPDTAVTFMDYLLSAETEQKLVDDGWIQIPINEGIQADPVVQNANVKIMDADFEKAFECLEDAINSLKDIFVR